LKTKLEDTNAILNIKKQLQQCIYNYNIENKIKG